MAADPTLAQGAYRASKHYDMGLRDSQRRLSDTLQKGIKPKQEEETVETSKEKAKTPDVEKKKVTTNDDPNSTEIVSNDDGNGENDVDPSLENNANKNAENGEGVNENDLDNVREELVGQKEVFYNAIVNKDNASIEEINRNLDKTKDEIEHFDEIFKGINENYLNRGEHTSYGYGNAFLHAPPEEKEWLMNIISKGSDGLEGKLSMQNGEMTVEMPNGEMRSASNLESYLEKYEMANVQFNEIHDLSLHYRDEGKNAGKTGVFNMGKAKGDISRIIDSGGENAITSLALDKSFGNTSYAEDLFNSDDLSSITYEELDLDPAEYDTDGDGLITPKDNVSDDIKNKIVRQLTTDSKYRDGLKGSMINYYTKHLERNFNAEHPGLSPKMPVGGESHTPTYTMSVDDLTNIE